MTKPFFVRFAEVPAYSPANHTETSNRRLVSRETVGAETVEVLHGTLQPGHGALPHLHPGIDQVCYMLKGRAIAEVEGRRAELGPGDACFFPAGKLHAFTTVGDEPVEVLVIYTPPYEESPARVVRPAAE